MAVADLMAVGEVTAAEGGGAAAEDAWRLGSVP